LYTTQVECRTFTPKHFPSRTFPPNPKHKPNPNPTNPTPNYNPNRAG